MNPYKSQTRTAPAPLIAPARAFLGMKGKSVHARKVDRPVDPGQYKARFALQRIAAGLLYGQRVTTKTGRERDRWAVCGCHRNMKGDVVGIFRAVDGSAARYAGTVTCGSVWTCPVCAGRVAESRRLELQLVIRRHMETKGNAVYLMTLTAPHTREMPLTEFRDKFKKALQKFKNCRTYKRLSAQYGRIGSIRSLEITDGAHGWHPHTHDLVIAREGLLDDAHGQEELRQEWVRVCLAVGLGDRDKRADMLEHGFDLRGGDYAADYVAKFGRQPSAEGWGVSDELTRSHSKTGLRAGSMTPFALLQGYREGDARCGERFREYAAAMEHERMLYWSPGLKKLFKIAEATDEDHARAPLPQEDRICELDGDQWRLVLSREARGELLYWAAHEGEAGVLAFLDELRERPRTYGNQFDNRTARQ